MPPGLAMSAESVANVNACGAVRAPLPPSGRASSYSEARLRSHPIGSFPVGVQRSANWLDHCSLRHRTRFDDAGHRHASRRPRVGHDPSEPSHECVRRHLSTPLTLRRGGRSRVPESPASPARRQSGRPEILEGAPRQGYNLSGSRSPVGRRWSWRGENWGDWGHQKAHRTMNRPQIRVASRFSGSAVDQQCG